MSEDQMPECPVCSATLEEAREDDPDNEFFCISCGGLFAEKEVDE